MNTDRIEKQVLLRAPLERVWRAISDSQEFGRWFGVSVDGPFVAGTSVTATVTGTTVDDEVAEMQRPHAGAKATWQIVAVEPPQRFAYRWHPFAVEPGVDYDSEPTTLVEFMLSDTPDGVQLRIVESGFDAIAETRRRDAFEANGRGWAKQTELVRKYLSLEQRV
ncbi:SRPBCC family protein [Mycobacterium paraterrae]|uniref:SRPBCC family protein n=1 Tax=Mycobacterium paraterrae TaxID=577492 RepID=A0ABY3VLR2_9MYCO|nr:SRPBCC family protein [Mycobacterium paraterrae]UMB68086.1 SRPBCC family protein [Mycobacterium paraterrae]